MAAVNRLAEFLPGGTFLTFTVLAQITADPNRITRNLNLRCAKQVMLNSPNATDQTSSYDGVSVFNMTDTLASILKTNGMSTSDPEITPCYCGDAVTTCGGPERYWLTAVLVIITGLICFVLALTNTSLEETPTTTTTGAEPSPAAAKAQTQAQTQDIKPTFTARLFSGRQQQDPNQLTATTSGNVITNEMLWNIASALSQFTLFDWLRAVGSTVIFLVLALLTPPVSTCFYPCMAPVVSQAIPLIIAFGISALLAVWNAAVRKAKKQQARAELAKRQQQKMQELEQKAKNAEQKLQEHQQNASLAQLPTFANGPVAPKAAVQQQQNNITIHQENFEVMLDMSRAKEGETDIASEDDTMISAFERQTTLQADQRQHRP